MWKWLVWRVKWLVAKDEMEELTRWRVQWQEYRRWLAEFEEVAKALDNMRAEVKGEQLNACHPPSDNGPWTLPVLREAMRKNRRTR